MFGTKSQKKRFFLHLFLGNLNDETETFFSETKFSETETETFFRDQIFSKPRLFSETKFSETKTETLKDLAKVSKPRSFKTEMSRSGGIFLKRINVTKEKVLDFGMNGEDILLFVRLREGERVS